MAGEGLGSAVGPMMVLMGAAAVAVPLFRRLGLGPVLGYFAAGVLVGPSALGLFTDPDAILHFAELGVVMFLFVVGLELRPQKLWAMRGEIFGLGLTQVFAAVALLTAGGVFVFGLAPVTAFVAASGFVLSSTAVIMSTLQERGELASPDGRKSVSILLFEDMLIVPLLAIVAFLSPLGQGEGGLQAAALAAAGLVALLAIGRWLLDPFFALLAYARTREVLTAGALLVVLGASLLMEAVGLSMAMGAFLAGVMLSGSSYRHQIESDVEPFKGLLMGLFFLAVGMSLNLSTVAAEGGLLVGLLLAFVAIKAIAIYAVARAFGSPHLVGARRAVMFAQGGEFAFVLYTAAAAGGVIDARENAIFSTVVILSMTITPLMLIAADRLLRASAPSLDGVERARDLKGKVLVIGFGRFGQIALQMLLARGVEAAVIDNNPDRIREAARFGFKVYYGDGSRLDVLHASGAGEAEVIIVAVDDRKAVGTILEIASHSFPNAQILARSFDRSHSIELIRAGVDFEIRETVESALVMGAEGLRRLGCDEVSVAETLADIRRRDAQRLTEQVQGDIMSGRDHMLTAPVPEPLTPVAGDAEAPAQAKSDVS